MCNTNSVFDHHYVTGAGGSQRLPKAIGKSKAMEMVLTGIPVTAQEMERSGKAKAMPLIFAAVN